MHRHLMWPSHQPFSALISRPMMSQPTNFNEIAQDMVHWWFNIFPQLFFQGLQMSPMQFLREEWIKLYQIWSGHRPIIGAPSVCFTSDTVCCSKPQWLKGECVVKTAALKFCYWLATKFVDDDDELTEATIRPFSPVKIVAEWANCHSAVWDNRGSVKN